MLVVGQFQEYTIATGWQWIDPDIAGGLYRITVVTRLLGDIVPIETYNRCSVSPEAGDDIVRKSDGIYYIETGDESLYSVGTWYEAYFTAVMGGETVASSRVFQFESMTAIPVVPVPEGSARIVAVALEVINYLNGASFSQPFTAVRGYTILYDVKALNELKVTVVPSSRETGAWTRKDQSELFQVVIAVQKRVVAEAQKDAMYLLVEQIIDYLNKKRLYGICQLTGLENKPACAPEHIRPYNVFTSIITVSFRRVV